MEKRRSQRTVISSKAELILGDKNYSGLVANVSEKGIFIIITAPDKTTIDFAPETTVELKFELPSGEILNLHSKIKWSYKTLSNHITYSIGMEIIEPPLKYKEFLETLS